MLFLLQRRISLFPNVNLQGLQRPHLREGIFHFKYTGFANGGIYPYNPNTIEQSKLAPSLNLSSSSSDKLCGSSATIYPASSGSNCDTSASTSVFSSDDSYIPSVNPSPMASSLSSHNADDGYCSPQVPGKSLTVILQYGAIYSLFSRSC